MKTRWAFVGRDASGNTLELTMDGPAAASDRLGGKLVTRMVLLPDPIGSSKPIRQLIVQVGDRDPVDVPLGTPGLPGQKFQNPDPKKLVGKATITSPERSSRSATTGTCCPTARSIPGSAPRCLRWGW